MAWIVCMLGATSLLNTAMEKADAQHVVPIYFAVQVHHRSFLSIRLPNSVKQRNRMCKIRQTSIRSIPSGQQQCAGLDSTDCSGR